MNALNLNARFKLFSLTFISIFNNLLYILYVRIKLPIAGITIRKYFETKILSVSNKFWQSIYKKNWICKISENHILFEYSGTSYI